MTRYTTEQIEQMKEAVIGKTVASLDYEPEDDYYVITFQDGSEMSFRFMADLL